MPSRRTVLAGLLASTWLPVARRAAAQASEAPAGLPHGWDPELDFPTEADLHVSPEGDDAGTGGRDRPFRTIQRGVDALAALGRGSLAIRGGTYREMVSLDALRGAAAEAYRIHRHGRERVTITGAEPLTGWRDPDPAEAAALQLPEGVVVATLDPARVAHGSMHALNLHLGGAWCPLASLRADAGDAASLADARTYLDARFALNGDGQIGAIQDDRLIGMDPARLRDARVRIYHFPNRASVSAIAEFHPDRGVIVPVRQDLPLEHDGDVPVTRYALENLASALRPGQWAVGQAEDGWRVYLRPQDRADLDAGVEVSVRPACLDLGAAENLVLGGLEMVRASGEDRLDGMGLRAADTRSEPRRGLRIEHCRVAECYSGASRAYGAIYVANREGVRLRHVSVADVRNNLGIFLNGCRDADLRGLHVADVSNAAVRAYGVREAVLAFSLFERTSRDTHANKFNFYEGCDRILVYGVRTRDTGGYATYQEASRIHFAFCDLDCDPAASNRALVSQNRSPGQDQGGADGTGDPVAGSTFYYWNNTLRPDPRSAEDANSLMLGPGDSSQRHAFFGNILHGGGVAPVYHKGADPRLERRSHNRYTGLSFWQARRYGWQPGPGEEVIRLAQRPRGAGFDMRPILAAEIAPLFPGFTDWDRDIDGTRFDWDSPPVGCTAA